MKCLLYFILFLSFFSCKTNKEMVEDTEIVFNGIDSPEDAHILTVILNFERYDNPNEDQINLFKTILAPGYMKKMDYDLNEHDLYQCAFLKGNKELLRFSFPDPLRKPMEFVGDDGQLQTSLVTSDKSAMPLRMNYIEGVNKIKLYRRSGDNYKNHKTFKLEYEN